MPVFVMIPVVTIAMAATPAVVTALE